MQLFSTLTVGFPLDQLRWISADATLFPKDASCTPAWLPFEFSLTRWTRL